MKRLPRYRAEGPFEILGWTVRNYGVKPSKLHSVGHTEAKADLVAAELNLRQAQLAYKAAEQWRADEERWRLFVRMKSSEMTVPPWANQEIDHENHERLPAPQKREGRNALSRPPWAK